MKPSERAFSLIKQFEGCRLTCYADITGLATIGYGHTSSLLQSDIGVKTITQEEADELLKNDVEYVATEIPKWVYKPLTQNQFDALCSFCFNMGIHNFAGSTMRQALNIGEYDLAADQFDKWVYANHQVVNGLVHRRAAEKELFNEQ